MKFPSEMSQITEVADDDYLLIGDASDSGAAKTTTVGDALASKQDVLTGTDDVPGLGDALASKQDVLTGTDDVPGLGDALASKQDVLTGTDDVPGLDDALGAKVDTVEGKGLSTNDFTNYYKEAIDTMVAAGPSTITIGDIS